MQKEIFDSFFAQAKTFNKATGIRAFWWLSDEIYKSLGLDLGIEHFITWSFGMGDIKGPLICSRLKGINTKLLWIVL